MIVIKIQGFTFIMCLCFFKVECFKEERKQQITSMIDKIVEGKRKKLLGISPNKKKKMNNDADNSGGNQTQDLDDKMEIDREGLIKEELDKTKPFDENAAIIQTFTG